MGNGGPRWETLWFIDRTRVEFLIAPKVGGWFYTSHWSGLLFSAWFLNCNSILKRTRRTYANGGRSCEFMCPVRIFWKHCNSSESDGAGCFRESQLAAHKNAGWPRSDDGSGVPGMNSSPGKCNWYSQKIQALATRYVFKFQTAVASVSFHVRLPHCNSILYLTDTRLSILEGWQSSNACVNDDEPATMLFFSVMDNIHPLTSVFSLRSPTSSQSFSISTTLGL